MRRKNPGEPADLFHHRWSVPVMAELHRSAGAKFVTLVNRLGVSRDTLSRTLQSLVRHEWVMRNPGHGHPMRPEYVLTKSGAVLAPGCLRLTKGLKRIGVDYATLRKWSVPTILALATGRDRFSDLRAFLVTPTPRALIQTLKDLQSAGLVERVVTDAYPPTTRYRLTGRGKRLAAVLADL